MDNRCFISVVLPVYNEAARNAVLESILQQRSPGGLFNFDNLEVIMVDNNSTDNSVALIEAFAAQHPQLTIHQLQETVQGVSSARKKAWISPHSAPVCATRPAAFSASTTFFRPMRTVPLMHCGSTNW